MDEMNQLLMRVGIISAAISAALIVLAVLFFRRYTWRKAGPRLSHRDAADIIKIVPTGRVALRASCWGNKSIHGTWGCGKRLNEVRAFFREPELCLVGNSAQNQEEYSTRSELWKSEDGGEGRILLQCPECETLFEPPTGWTDLSD